jgi:NAD(P)H-dependent FMN reductase
MRDRAEMKIAIIAGSHRANSESDRVASFVQGQLNSLGVSASVVSLAGNPLPLWDESVWGGAEEWKEAWNPIAESLQQSEAFVVVAPEWAGMVPPGLKNFFLLCGVKEVGHKPALIVSVSAGVGGSYPVAELRVSSYKNNRLVYIPEHVIIRNVGEMLHGSEAASDRDREVRGRLGHGLAILVEYGKALAQIRASGVINYKEFPYGM